MTACTVIALLGTQASGAAGAHTPSADSRAQKVPQPRVTAPEHCPSVQKALRWYTKRWKHWALLRGAGTKAHSTRIAACPRYLLHIRQRKAFLAHREWNRYFHEQYVWSDWLPAKFYRVARCETGVRWDWDSGTYVSAFGIIRVAYEWYHPWTGHNTPREQYEVAAAIQRRFGWGAWGCGGA